GRRAGGDERGRLVRDDAEVGGLVDVEAAGLLDLEELPLAHAADGVGDDVEEAVVPVVEGEEEPAREEEVAEEDGHLVLPQRVDREHAAPALGLVHHVVVDEGGRVEELDEGGGAVALLRDAAAERRREEHERGADLLPLLAEDVLRDAVEEADARAHRLAEVPPERRELRLDGPPDLGEAEGPGDGGRRGGGSGHGSFSRRCKLQRTPRCRGARRPFLPHAQDRGREEATGADPEVPSPPSSLPIPCATSPGAAPGRRRSRGSGRRRTRRGGAGGGPAWRGRSRGARPGPCTAASPRPRRPATSPPRARRPRAARSPRAARRRGGGRAVRRPSGSGRRAPARGPRRRTRPTAARSGRAPARTRPA